MNCADFNTQILVPALAFIRANLKNIPASVEEHTMLLAISGQESDWTALRQANNGPAASNWQMERGGGIISLMRDDETSKQVAMLCGVSGVQFQSTAIWRFMCTSQGVNFSAAMARLLLWSDPMPLPKTMEDSYEYYLRNWRPGKPSQERWESVSWPQSVAAIAAGAKV